MNKQKWYCPKCNNGDESALIEQIILQDRKYLSKITTLKANTSHKLSHFCGQCDMIFVTETSLSSSTCYWEEKKPDVKMQGLQAR